MTPAAPTLYIDANVIGDLLKQFRSAIPDANLTNARGKIARPKIQRYQTPSDHQKNDWRGGAV